MNEWIKTGMDGVLILYFRMKPIQKRKFKGFQM